MRYMDVSDALLLCLKSIAYKMNILFVLFYWVLSPKKQHSEIMCIFFYAFSEEGLLAWK